MAHTTPHGIGQISPLRHIRCIGPRPTLPGEQMVQLRNKQALKRLKTPIQEDEPQLTLINSAIIH